LIDSSPHWRSVTVPAIYQYRENVVVGGRTRLPKVDSRTAHGAQPQGDIRLHKTRN
jgi:hypothetical protein